MSDLPFGINNTCRHGTTGALDWQMRAWQQYVLPRSEWHRHNSTRPLPGNAAPNRPTKPPPGSAAPRNAADRRATNRARWRVIQPTFNRPRP
eukprot:4118045-Amphidinium_carterae.1